jgi:transposase
VVADAAYDDDRLCDPCEGLDATLVSPHRADRTNPPRDQGHIGRLDNRRWAVEGLVSWLAALRRLAIRWERRAERY